MSVEYPEDLLYTEDHEWTRIEGNVATVGITPPVKAVCDMEMTPVAASLRCWLTRAETRVVCGTAVALIETVVFVSCAPASDQVLLLPLCIRRNACGRPKQNGRPDQRL